MLSGKRSSATENTFLRSRHELNYNHEQREARDSENTKGARNSGADTGGVREEPGQGGEAGERITASPHEEELTRTSPDHRLGGYTATHTRSGSLEDA